MKQVEVFQWCTLWLGKMTKTRYKGTEEEVRKYHPEAVKVENTRELRWLPESSAEYHTAAMTKPDGRLQCASAPS